MPGAGVGVCSSWHLHRCRSWSKELEVPQGVSPSPSHPRPHPQAPAAGLAWIHATRRPCPPAGLPGLAQLRPRGGSGRPPWRGEAAGRAAAQLLPGAGGALRGGGFPVPAHVVTPSLVTPHPRAPAGPPCPAGLGKQPRGQRGGRNAALEPCKSTEWTRTLRPGCAVLVTGCTIPADPRVPGQQGDPRLCLPISLHLEQSERCHRPRNKDKKGVLDEMQRSVMGGGTQDIACYSKGHGGTHRSQPGERGEGLEPCVYPPKRPSAPQSIPEPFPATSNRIQAG